MEYSYRGDTDSMGIQMYHYGINLDKVSTLNAMSILRDGALDKAMNLLRICVCKCLAC